VSARCWPLATKGTTDMTKCRYHIPEYYDPIMGVTHPGTEADCDQEATHWSCQPYLGTPTCAEHSCRCASPISGTAEGTKVVWEQDTIQRLLDERGYYRDKKREADQALASSIDNVTQLQAQLRELTAERDELLSLERAIRLRWNTWSPESFKMWLGDCDMRLRKLDALRSNRRRAGHPF
jgi:hypothetical protein